MNGWSLDEVQNLDMEVYGALVEWINRTSQPDDPEGSIDMDALIAAKKAADAHGD